MNRLLAGAIAGTAATVPMTALMVYLHRRIPPGERRMLPPKQVAGKMASEAGAEGLVDREDELLATTGVTHFGYGAAMGAVYAAVAPHLDVPAEAKGTAFGLGLWAGSYLEWLPAAGIRAPATRRPARSIAVARVCRHTTPAAISSASGRSEPRWPVAH